MANSKSSTRKAANVKLANRRTPDAPAKVTKPTARTSKASLKSTGPADVSDAEANPPAVETLPTSRAARTARKVDPASNKAATYRKASTAKKEAQAARARPSTKEKQRHSQTGGASDEAAEILKLKGKTPCALHRRTTLNIPFSGTCAAQGHCASNRTDSNQQSKLHPAPDWTTPRFAGSHEAW